MRHQLEQAMARAATIVQLHKTIWKVYKAADATDIPTRLFLTLRDSADQKISKAVIEIRTGRKWSASKASAPPGHCWSYQQRSGRPRTWATAPTLHGTTGNQKPTRLFELKESAREKADME
ncbi:hypothetical protein DPMN_183363 [Dreissena polymorpha]|uniref:Uncharacterized protein n=1 Tax=Dreissena polymorpha TaxID=45954 RepID=A0A9D4DGH1_DREPO|nr:hypothetical protein DPMN_183363 [Dreissena polymorpha]